MPNNAVRKPIDATNDSSSSPRITSKLSLTDSRRLLSEASPEVRIRRQDMLVISLLSMLSLYGGTPYDHPDFLTAFVGNVFRNGGNPKFFHYGSFAIYAHSFIYGLTYVLLLLTGRVASVNEFQQLLDSDYFLPQPWGISVFLPGQLFSYACSFLGLTAVFWLTQYLTQRRFWSYVAVAILGTSYQWVIDSHFLTVDVPMAAFVIAGVGLAIGLVNRVSMKSYARILGACAGLAASTKYPGGMIVLPFALSICFLKTRFYEKCKLILSLGLTAFFVFLACNPFIVFDFQTFWQDFTMELAHAKVGHPGFMSPSFWFQTKYSLRNSLGIVGLVAALGGASFLFIQKPRDFRVLSLLLVYPILQFLVISSSKLAFQRYAVPLLPFLSVFAAYALATLSGTFQRESQQNRSMLQARTLMATLLALLVIAPNFFLSFQSTQMMRGPDSRQGIAALAPELPAGPIYVSNYLKYYFRHRERTPQSEAPIQALFMDSFTYDRDLYEECRVEPSILSLLSELDRVLIINPYTQEKSSVPFSPQSIFGPGLPDLPYRRVAGPYIEVYFSSKGPLASQWANRASAYGVIRPAQEGYYANKLPPKCQGTAQKAPHDIEKVGYKALHSTRL